MCRNITMLRGLEPVATPDEIEAAAIQFIRKVSGVTGPTPATAEAFNRAVASVAATTTQLLAELPPRRQPPPTMPPLRRIAIRRATGIDPAPIHRPGRSMRPRPADDGM